MKRTMNTLHRFLLCAASALCLAGCHYLDVDPELGVTDEDVFASYNNFSRYFLYCYEPHGGRNKGIIALAYPFYYDLNQAHRLSWVTTTDAADCGALDVAQLNFKQCNLTQDVIYRLTFDRENADAKPICYAMFFIIRQANYTIERIDECKNITEEQYNDLLGQCYFMRGCCHFVLARQFGGMPYIDHTIGADDEWDLPRESSHSTFVKAAEDCYKGYEYLKKAGYMRRDARPGQSGHLISTTIERPNGVAALGLRARCLLYAASPLSNELGNEDWARAAEACADALRAAEEEQYELLPLENYTDNFYGKEATNECIWFFMRSLWKDNHANYRSFFAYPQSHNARAAGVCPTQNFVDRFETIDGYALNTPDDRALAAAMGSYLEQDPFCLAEGTSRGRDPRLDICIVHDGSTNDFVTGGINICYDPSTRTYPTTVINGVNEAFAIEWGSRDNEYQSYSNTGYYCNKYWTGARGDKQVSAQPKIDPLIRLADLYLMYGEATNEAYGPNGRAGGYELSALEAVNKVRARAGMPSVREEYLSSKEAFRERIRNERCVELAYESNHYYFDIRRWMIAPQTMDSSQNPLYGMWVEKCDVSPEHPAGRIYERRRLPENRQGIWKDCMYYFPFPDSEANKLKNFQNNPAWR